MHKNQLISLTIFQKINGQNRTVLTVKDSLKMIPGALGKLAIEFQVPTRKDHFPHYFLVNGEISKTLAYVGPLPEYRFFEPKRTSQADYHEMLELYRNSNWYS